MKRVVMATLAIVSATVFAQTRKPTSCVNCHSNVEFHQDAHAEVGLSCHDCHGGNPDPRLSDDMPGAMDESFKPNPYRGKVDRIGIPDFCGRCHSSPDFMRRFRPDIRVDQVAEYRTSQHGKALARGDQSVATCIDCHGVHRILRAGNPQSPVYPNRVAETCSSCHSNPQRMAGHRLPVDQFARWRSSVHAAAMIDKGDLSAPTCNDCHGNHGAAPPGVGSVAFVCGTCHGREAELFRSSAKREGFAEHNTLIADNADCSLCHENVSKRAHVRRFEECVTCHENHAVIRPTVALLGNLPDTPCAFCHEGTGALALEVREPRKTAEHYQRVRGELLSHATRLKLAGETRFDWLVDQARALPTHTIVREGEPPALRAEFARLFDKFRIGKTHYTYIDPLTLKPASVDVLQCTDCHTDPAAPGLSASRQMLAKMRELTALTARAERILLAAHRGGVEVRAVRPELDGAVDKQIELEVLVHSFSAGATFDAKHREGVKHAAAALEAGQQSLGELSYRRRGLSVALGFIALTLVALALKIRQLDRR